MAVAADLSRCGAVFNPIAVEKTYASVFQEANGYYINNVCSDNVYRLVELLNDNGLDISDATVLLVYSRIGDEPFNIQDRAQRIFPSNYRGTGGGRWKFHTVLNHHGMIYDFDFTDNPRPVAAQTWLEKMWPLNEQSDARDYYYKAISAATYLRLYKSTGTIQSPMSIKTPNGVYTYLDWITKVGPPEAVERPLRLLPIDRLLFDSPVAAARKRRDRVLGQLETKLVQNAFGQPNVATGIINALAKRRRQGAAAGVLIFGPTGVEKTKVVDELARLTDGRPIVFDGRKFDSKSSMGNLAHGSESALFRFAAGTPIVTQQMLEDAKGRANPLSIVLINDFDKAWVGFRKWWLGAVGNGSSSIWKSVDEPGGRSRLQTQRIDFSNVIVIATTSIGGEIALAEASAIAEYFRQNDPRALAEGIGPLAALRPRDRRFEEKAHIILARELKDVHSWDAIVPVYPLHGK